MWLSCSGTDRSAWRPARSGNDWPAPWGTIWPWAARGSTYASPSVSGRGRATSSPPRSAAAALAPLRVTRRLPGTNGHRSTPPFVAVTHVPDHPATALLGPLVVPTPDVDDPCRTTFGRLPRRLDHRVFVTLSEDHDLGDRATITPAGWEPFGAADAAPSLTGSGLRVLLVDPEAHPDRGPRPLMEAVVDVARRCGAEPVLSPAVDTDAVLLDLYLAKPDVVLIVVQGEVPRFGSGAESVYGWDRPARITRALRDAGTSVIALSVGASAAALAVCVEQGAVGLLHTDLLSQELARQAARRLNGNGGGSQNGADEARGPGQLPAPYNTLVHLTPSERRVLFHMMEGRSAAEIATTLVVSLTTVRSHIRSILRKLNVNSQLAAVALAFGTLPDQALAE